MRAKAVDDIDKVLKRFYAHRANAKLRNIPFLLTFHQWRRIWLESGKWDQCGWRRGQYCMARFGDRGAYEIGNVRICLAEENRAERNQNYPMKGEKNPAYGKNYLANASAEERERRAAITSKTFKGKPKSPEQRAKMSTAAYGPGALEQRRQLSITARTRRAVIRDGRRVWAHPGDADYPVSAV